MREADPHLSPRSRLPIVKIAALLIGMLIVAQGILGLAAPDTFLGLVRWFQAPPVIYAAAVIRFGFGVVLFLAAPASRFPIRLRVLGALIAAGGLLTPFFGIEFARWILPSWSGSSLVVRTWAFGGLVLGIFIVVAMAPRRRAG